MENSLPFDVQDDFDLLSPEGLSRYHFIKAMRPDMSHDDIMSQIISPEVIPPLDESYKNTLDQIQDNLDRSHWISETTGRYCSDMDSLANCQTDIAYNQVLKRFTPMSSPDVNLENITDDEMRDLVVDPSRQRLNDALSEAQVLTSQLNSDE